MSHVVTFGEIMLRLTTPGHERFAQASHFEITFGGAEANVAVVIAQLGGSAEFVTRLPTNEIAQRALDQLRSLGVGVRYVKRGGDRLGVYYLEQGASQRAGKVVYDRAHSAIAEMAAEDFDWLAVFAGAGWFHWTGITPALSPAVARVTGAACEAARRAGLTVSFDMNYRSKLWNCTEAGATLRPLMKYVDVCICGAEEARNVFGLDADSDRTLARTLGDEFGFKTVAMTRREKSTASQTNWSASLYADGNEYASARREITIVDRVGAGDSFTGALIFSLMRGDGGQTAIDFAVAASTLKHSIPGDYALLSLAEVEALARGAQGGRVQR